MADKRDKTITYRRAEWLAPPPRGGTLEACLKAAHSSLKTVADRTIIRDSGQCIRSARKYAPRDGGIFVHIIADTPGERASVVPKIKREEEVDVDVAPAPDNAEFMDGDAFLFVEGNNVCMCSTGIRDGAIRLFLYEFFQKAGIGENANKFDLLKAANIDKLKLMKSEGVKQVELRASVFEATALYENRKATASGMLRTLANQIRKIVEAEVEDIDDSLRVEIIIKTDERRKKHLKLGEKRIETLATDVVNNYDEDDEFVIVTNSGQKISAGEIAVKEVIPIDSFGKSVKCQKAWDALAGC